MKNFIYLFLVSLFVCVSCSEEEQMESVSQDKEFVLDFKEIAKFLKGEDAKTARAELSKGDNSGNGVYFVSAFTSFSNNHGFFYPVPNTDYFMALDSPSDGRDRGIILDDGTMRLNWNIRNPRLFLYDVNTGITKYTANYCNDDKTGLFQLNAVVAYNAIDINDDGEYDIYLYRFISDDNPNKNGNMNLKATLTDALTSDPWSFPRSENCGTATEEVELSYKIKGDNEAFTIVATLR